MADPIKSKPVAKRIEVDLFTQTLKAYEDSKLVFKFDCVSGDKDHPTDTGRFVVRDRVKYHKSRKYGANMNYSLFFTEDGKAIHQYHGPVPVSILRTMKQHATDRIGSHGCVRLSEKDAKALFEWTPRGTSVRIR